MADSVATCVWRISPDVLLALDERLGPPDDTYVNGSQVWLADNGPSGARLEWRLHPVAGFRRPLGIAAEELLAEVIFALRAGESRRAAPEMLWDGLECFPMFPDEIEPAPLAAGAAEVLGIAPDAFGVVDHTPIGDAWEHSQGQVSIIDMLFEQLRPSA